jgi:hypothetical protein
MTKAQDSPIPDFLAPRKQVKKLELLVHGIDGGWQTAGIRGHASANPDTGSARDWAMSIKTVIRRMLVEGCGVESVFPATEVSSVGQHQRYAPKDADFALRARVP